MRTNTRDLAHKFAADPRGAGTSSGAAHYANGTYYSYAAPLAEMTDRFEDNRPIVRFNTKRYSVTTSKHQTWLRYALKQAGYVLQEEEFNYDR